MMRLTTLWNVDPTVNADGESPLAQEILEPWEYDRGSVRFFRSSANFLYVFRREGKRCFLRFAHSSERTRETVEAEIDLLRWLAGAGMTVATPVQSRAGSFVETAVTARGTFHAVVFAGLEGSQLDIEDLADLEFEEWGATLGKLHATMSRYTGPGLSTRSTWKDHLRLARAYIPANELAIREELDQIESSLRSLPVSDDTYGLIHCDFELDNLCWRDHTVGILDFDDCSRYWYVADIAFALRDLFGDHFDPSDRSFRAFIRGYGEHYPLDEALLAYLPTFLRAARIVAYGRITRAMDLPDDHGHPEWLRALRQKLENWTAQYRKSLEHQRS